MGQRGTDQRGQELSHRRMDALSGRGFRYHRRRYSGTRSPRRAVSAPLSPCVLCLFLRAYGLRLLRLERSKTCVERQCWFYLAATEMARQESRQTIPQTENHLSACTRSENYSESRSCLSTSGKVQPEPG